MHTNNIQQINSQLYLAQVLVCCVQRHWSLLNSVMHMVSLSLSDAIITDDYYGWNVTAQRTSRYSHRLIISLLRLVSLLN